MSWRISCRGRVFTLPIGTALVGRGAACDVLIDDVSVSRRHAVFRATAAALTVDDAGSRNGVFVNGSVVKGPTQLREGDVIRLGDSQLSVVAAGSSLRDTAPQLRLVSDVGVPEGEGQSLLSLDPAPTSPSALLLGLAEKSLAMKRPEDAGWILQKLTAEIDERLASGRTVAPETIDPIASCAVGVAAATDEPQWLDWLFATYTSLHRVVPAALIDELHPVVRALRYPATPALSSYLDDLRSHAADLSPAARFLLGRLEGLLAVASSG